MRTEDLKKNREHVVCWKPNVFLIVFTSYWLLFYTGAVSDVRKGSNIHVTNLKY